MSSMIFVLNIIMQRDVIYKVKVYIRSWFCVCRLSSLTTRLLSLASWLVALTCRSVSLTTRLLVLTTRIRIMTCGLISLTSRLPSLTYRFSSTV